MKIDFKGFSERVKRYETKHPFKIIILPVFITLFMVGIIVACIYTVKVREIESTSYIQFSDVSFEKEIQVLLKKEHFTLSELQDVSSLIIENNYELENISDLVYFSNLKSLSIRHCNISDISVLGKLDKLTTLDLTGNNVSDLTPLSTCNNLEQLLLEDNNITDITPLYSLSNLKTLMLQQNNISIIPSGIEQMSGLNTISVEGNRLINIDELANAPNLSYLYAPDNKISVTPHLERMNNLVVLDLGDNSFQDLGYMGDLEQ